MIKNNKKLSLGVLDQSPVRYGGTARDALRESVELAKTCEKYGYGRYWVAEHHNTNSFASTSPEIIIGKIASVTQSIRLGSGGIMLPNYSSLKIAEKFNLLESFYPGRIDLGLGKSRGTDTHGAEALAYPNKPIDFSLYDEQVKDLLAYLHKKLPPEHRFSQLVHNKHDLNSSIPTVWILGSGINSAKLAAELGLPFSFAHFLRDELCQNTPTTKAYLNNFKSSCFLNEPKISIAIEVICSEYEEKAKEISYSRTLEKAASSLDLLEYQGFFPPQDAKTYLQDAVLKKASYDFQSLCLVSDRKNIKTKIEEIADHYHANEVLILTNCFSFEDRKLSYKYIAEAFF